MPQIAGKYGISSKAAKRHSHFDDVNDTFYVINSDRPKSLESAEKPGKILNVDANALVNELLWESGLASEHVRGEVRPQAWQAFWEVAVSGTSVAED